MFDVIRGPKGVREKYLKEFPSSVIEDLQHKVPKGEEHFGVDPGDFQEKDYIAKLLDAELSSYSTYCDMLLQPGELMSLQALHSKMPREVEAGPPTSPAYPR